MRATPAARVRREIDRCLAGRYDKTPPASARALLGRGDAARNACVETLDAAWHALVEPWWAQIRQTLDADIAYRARLLADAGLPAALADLHPRLTWTDNAAHVDTSSEETLLVGPEGIVLVPTVFGFFEALGVANEPPSINYAARGIASLWITPDAPAEPLKRLLGPRRATLLLHLDIPASTSGLAARCQLPLSSVSEHLTVLREAGLVSTTRTGRQLQHTRTPLGTALVEPSPP